MGRALSRTFWFAFAGGVIVAVLAAGLPGLPEQYRFRSLIDVQTNGGRSETFVIRWPQDRLDLSGELVVGDRVTRAVAQGMMVLDDAAGRRLSAELFRLRDREGNVIGLAGRMSNAAPGAPASSSDWLLVIPARGSLALTQADARDLTVRRIDDGQAVYARAAVDAPGFWAAGRRYRISAGPLTGAGRVVHGSDEFAGLEGRFTESWELEEMTADGATRGRIVLETLLQRGSP
jgi:hypothetical protein